jgi:hypothetical protein
MEIYFLTPLQAYPKLRNLVINKGCTQAHHDNITDFNGAQKTLFLFLMKKLEKLLDKYLIEVGRIEFVLLKAGVYWDYPFTYGESIISVTPKLFEQSNDKILKVLAHEWVHLDQKRSPEKYEKYYTTLGFRKAQVRYGILESRLLRNPDADKYEWIWTYKKKIYAPVALLVDCKFHSVLLEIKNPKMTVDSPEVIIHMATDITPYHTRFGTTKQLYHPNEIVAHIIADFVVDRVKHVPIDYDQITKLLMN